MVSNSVALLYNFAGTQKGRKIKFVLIRMGIRIKNIEKKDYLQPAGALAGVPGILADQPEYEKEGFTEEMLVMYNFTEKQLDEMLLRFRKEKIPKIELKAVITPTNCNWNSLKLFEEIKKERQQMEERDY